MIVSRIIGGLGNQLFCYAAARRLALINSLELVIDDVTGFAQDRVYGRHYQLDHFCIPYRKATAKERLEPFSKIRRGFLRLTSQFKPFEIRGYIQQEKIDFDARFLNIRPEGTVYIEGYWQSECYFKDVEPWIRQDLRMIPPDDEANIKISRQIARSCAVAVHVRFFDFPGEAGINNAPEDYYARAVRKMEDLVPNAHYFVFSDQPEAARKKIPLDDTRVTMVAHNRGDLCAHADFWLMTQCHHFIIANSTFSWWGAWLAECPNKYVIAPGFEMRQGKMWWGFDGLLPEEWIKL